MTDDVSTAPRSRLSSSTGVVALQAFSSVSTVVHLALFAVLLPRALFDDYSVWITSSMFAIGLGQAVGSERVVIGRRSREDGLRSAWVLALLIALVQLGMGLFLDEPVLAVASLAVLTWALWDYLRIVDGFERAGAFLARDALTLVVQAGGAGVAHLLGAPGEGVVLVWWGVGLVLWSSYIVQWAMARSDRRRGGLGVLWADRRESAPLLLDAALAGVPIVLALAVANREAAEGVASEARMAFTLLGPVAVLGIAGRRIVYAARAQGGFTARTRLMFVAAIAVVFAVCFVILTMTRTPLYPFLLPGFAGLAWLAVLAFSINHAAVMAALLPAADLRAEQRTLAVGAARVVSTLTAVAYAVLDTSFDSVTDVAWCVSLSSIVYALALVGAQRLPHATPTADPRGVS